MKIPNKSYLFLILWITALLTIGSLMGALTKSEISTWYSALDRSPLTPPNYVFPIAWTILYAIIAICGWIIWQATSMTGLRLTKFLYAMQLILNFSWTPLFFRYHLHGLSLIVLIAKDIIAALIIYLTYKKFRSVSLLMFPYLLWILFATYLNFYIWQHN